MSAQINPADWLRAMEREYLASFIRDGGSAVKFAIPMEPSLRADLLSGLTAAGVRNGYLTAGVNAGETKCHMVDELFFRVAGQIPWAALIRRVIAKVAIDAGYTWVDRAEGPLYRHLAEVNQVEPPMLLLDMKQAIWKRVFNERALSRDFRVAMTHLCVAELSGGQDGATAIRVLTDWLSGKNRAISAVKPYQIYRKINRSNGRFFFESLANWVRLAGYPGMLIVLDAQRLAVTRNLRDNSLFYTKAAVMDTYEVLRQFVDGTDRLNGCLLAVAPDPSFLDDPSRGIAAYEALKFRIFDEVRDARLVNPMAALARISAERMTSL